MDPPFLRSHVVYWAFSSFLAPSMLRNSCLFCLMWSYQSHPLFMAFKMLIPVSRVVTRTGSMEMPLNLFYQWEYLSQDRTHALSTPHSRKTKQLSLLTPITSVTCIKPGACAFSLLFRYRSHYMIGKLQTHFLQTLHWMSRLKERCPLRKMVLKLLRFGKKRGLHSPLWQQMLSVRQIAAWPIALARCTCAGSS